MTSSRKGLRRAGMRTYRIDGPNGSFEIERERPWRWKVRVWGLPPAFYYQAFRRLGEARAAAEQWAGVT